MGDFKKRLPLWLNRLRSKKLLEAVRVYPDFPILLETWRTCLQDEFDLDNLKQLLDEIRDGRIKITEAVTTAASPFADGLIWKQTNTYMYADDSPRSGKTSGLSRELLKEVALFPSPPAAPFPGSRRRPGGKAASERPRAMPPDRRPIFWTGSKSGS